MELYFARHGHAQPVAESGVDEERPLSDRGRAEVAAVARLLAAAGAKPEVILTSPLLRARQTGEVFSESLGVPAESAEPLRPGCRLDRLAQLLRPGLARILLVGHEPDISTMVGELVGGAQLRMPAGAVAAVEVRDLRRGGAVLEWLLPPSLAAAASAGG